MAILPQPNVDYYEFTERPVYRYAPVKSGRPSEVWVNERAFKKPLTPESAYWLGMLWADGNVRANEGRSDWAVQFGLQKRDRAHVKAFHRFIGGTMSEAITVWRVLVHRQSVCIDVMNLGVVPRKSSDPGEPPKLRGRARIGFLRGAFDGNGCLHTTKRGYPMAVYAGHYATAGWMLDQLGIDHNGVRYRGKCAYVQWTSPPKARAVARKLYGGDCMPVLRRKVCTAREWGVQ